MNNARNSHRVMALVFMEGKEAKDVVVNCGNSNLRFIPLTNGYGPQNQQENPALPSGPNCFRRRSNSLG